MIKPLRFPKVVAGNPSAFTRHNKPRMLTVTLHCLEGDASPIEHAAVSLLRELSYLEELEVADTAPGSCSHLTIAEYDAAREFLPVELRRVDSVRRWAIRCIELWPHWMASLEKTGKAAVSTLWPQFPFLQAHLEGHRDLLITTNPALLAYADQFPNANAMTPVQRFSAAPLSRSSPEILFNRGRPRPKPGDSPYVAPACRR